MTPRPFQTAAIDYFVDWFRGAGPGDKTCVTAPTGAGKSIIELAVLERDPEVVLVTPKPEIMLDMLRKRGEQFDSVAEGKRLANEARIWTPITLRNRLAQGVIGAPKKLLFDEVHHHEAETYEILDILSLHAPAAGMTATAFRGTPKSTAEFRRKWGEPIPAISLREAVEERYISMPTCRVVPLVDDDLISVANGDFIVKSVNDATAGAIPTVAEMCKQYYSGDYGDFYDRATMLSWPSREILRTALATFKAAGLPCVGVDADTPAAQRQEAFAACVERRELLFHINVVSEGIDLPIRRLIDLHPTLSPVFWQQQLGRIMRPSVAPPEYICTNRNLLRHCYLLEGLLPIATVVSAEKAFPSSKRSGTRAIGLEAIGRFKVINVPLTNGLNVQLYCVSAVDNNVVTHYAAVAHPLTSSVIYATRTDGINRDTGTRDYGHWRRVEELPTIEVGFKSVAAQAVTDKMKSWWDRTAARYGIGLKEPTRDQFQLMPLLKDLGVTRLA